ncbi:hypothetical protein NFA_44290 [Nocardia farcinica IFM 10152]|uniref:Uncharacterized protein n=1 Tax=Nocardia farcinica (strain IFM 10152) TaxID=247156 RepID=Q5YRB1_NOCFA|nr:hypothetical protein NFA_44290 [Nocardia farcinica IFM 10152]
MFCCPGGADNHAARWCCQPRVALVRGSTRIGRYGPGSSGMCREDVGLDAPIRRSSYTQIGSSRVCGEHLPDLQFLIPSPQFSFTFSRLLTSRTLPLPL